MKIDYKAYVSQIGPIESDAKTRIKNYLEERCSQDEAFKKLYRPELLDECYEFIKNAVKEMASASGIYGVDYSIVYKMAVDFFEKILEPVDVSEVDTTDVIEAIEKDAAEETQERPPLVIEAIEEDKKVTDEYGFEVYGEKTEESVPCHQEENTDNVFMDGMLYEPGDIIDRAGRPLFEQEMIKDQRFVFTNYPRLNNIVCVVNKSDGLSIRYGDGTNFAWITRSEFKQRNICAVPEGAQVIGKYDGEQRIIYEKEKVAVPYREYDEEGNGLLFGF